MASPGGASGGGGGSPSWSPFGALYGVSPRGGGGEGQISRGLMPTLTYAAQSIAGAVNASAAPTTVMTAQDGGPQGTYPAMASTGVEGGGYRIASGIVRAPPPRLTAHRSYAQPQFYPQQQQQPEAHALYLPVDQLDTSYSDGRLVPPGPPTEAGASPSFGGPRVPLAQTYASDPTSAFPPSSQPMPPPPPRPTTAADQLPSRDAASSFTRFFSPHSRVTLPSTPSTVTDAMRYAPAPLSARPPSPPVAQTPHPPTRMATEDDIHASARRLNRSNRSALSAISAAQRHSWSANSGAGGLLNGRSGGTAQRHADWFPPPTFAPAEDGDALAQAVDLAENSCCVMALLDNGHHEVGVALCVLPAFSLMISQFGDTYTFAKSVSLLAARNPVELLVPHTAIYEECTQTLLRHFGSVLGFTSVRRRFFNAEAGVARLQALRSSDECSATMEDTDQYLCVAAANALLTYMEQLHGMQWMPRSLRVTYLHLDKYVSISRATARALHLLPSSVYDAAAGPVPSTETHEDTDGLSLSVGPLVKALPRPSTAMGQRMLRASVVQPLRDHGAIEDRLDAVEWLMREPTLFVSLREHVAKLAHMDLDRLLATFLWRAGPLVPTKQRQLLTCLVQVWNSLDVLLRLQRALQGIVDSAASVMRAPVPNLVREILRTLKVCQLEELVCTASLYLDPVVRGVFARTAEGGDGAGVGRRARSRTRAPASRQTQWGSHGIGAPASRNVYDSDFGTNVTTGRSATAEEEMSQSLRAYFAVVAAPGSALDVARSWFTQQTDAITRYCGALGRQFNMTTLQLEPDAEKLYCLSYAASEDVKAPNHIFKYKYAGGQHFALYMEALKSAQERAPRHGVVERGCGDRAAEEMTPRGQASWLAPASYTDSLPYATATSAPPHAEWMAATSMATTTAPQSYHNSAITSTDKRDRRRGQRRIRCTTDELEGLCRAAQQFGYAILADEVAAVQSLLDTLHQHLGRLQAIGESVALLDLLLTFSGYARMRGCVRPSWSSAEVPADTETPASPTPDMVHAAVAGAVSDSGASSSDLRHPRGATPLPTVALHQLRHPSARPPATLTYAAGRGGGGGGEPTSSLWMGVPNDVVWPTGARTLIVTGPNAGGKSTLLQQVGQTFVLAQAGCFVPATSARLFLADSIAAHMLCNVLPLAEMSSFRRELIELAAITSAVTANSLVLIDELGRSTRTSQGFTLAWSTLCFLRRRHVHSLSATHFIGLTRLSAAFADVANVHFAETTASSAHEDNIAPAPRFELDRSADVRTTDASRHSDVASPRPFARPLRRTFLYLRHRLMPGVCPLSEYGLQLASQLGFHKTVLSCAELLIAAEREDASETGRLELPTTDASASPLSPHGVREVDANTDDEAIITFDPLTDSPTDATTTSSDTAHVFLVEADEHGNDRDDTQRSPVVETACEVEAAVATSPHRITTAAATDSVSEHTQDDL